MNEKINKKGRIIFFAIMAGFFVGGFTIAIAFLGTWLIEAKNINPMLILILFLMPAVRMAGVKIEETFKDIL